MQEMAPANPLYFAEGQAVHAEAPDEEFWLASAPESMSVINLQCVTGPVLVLTLVCM